MKHQHAFAVLGRQLNRQDFNLLLLVHNFPRVPMNHLEKAQPPRRRRVFSERFRRLYERSLIRPEQDGWSLS